MTWAELRPAFAKRRYPCAERASAHGLIARNNHFTPNFGEEYYDVLYGCYCRSRKAADVDIMIELGMSRATFYRKKKAALRYLGYYFFEIVVPQSANKRYKPSFPVEEE